MDIIPAIDIKDGKCVRLYQGDFARMTIYDHDPAAVAQRWEAQGARMLHVVDLDGARAGHPVNTDIILAIVQSVSVPVQIGGGLRDEKAVLAALGLGVSRVVLGTAAVEQPELIARLVERYGDEIAIGVDARDGIVATAGWVEQSQVTATALIDHMAALGVRHVIAHCTAEVHASGTGWTPATLATIDRLADIGFTVTAAGGIDADTLPGLTPTRAAIFVVGRSIVRATDPRAEAERLRALLD